MENNIENFIFRNPRWTFYLALVGVLIFLCVAVTVSILFCIGIIGFLPFIISVSIFCVLFLVSVFCLYCDFKEKFIFKEDTFTYVSAIKKPQSIHINNLSCVNIYPSEGYTKVKNWCYVKLYHKGTIVVEFVDKNGDIVIKFTDCGVVFKDNLFGTVLLQKNIIVNEYSKETV